MANITSNNPWVLDSTGAVTTMNLRVKGVRWSGGTTAGHAAIIKDKNGAVVWSSLAAGANNVEADDINNPGGSGLDWQGLTVDTLASGKLYIELL